MVYCCTSSTLSNWVITWFKMLVLVWTSIWFCNWAWWGPCVLVLVRTWCSPEWLFDVWVVTWRTMQPLFRQVHALPTTVPPSCLRVLPITEYCISLAPHYPECTRSKTPWFLHGVIINVQYSRNYSYWNASSKSGLIVWWRDNKFMNTETFVLQVCK